MNDGTLAMQARLRVENLKKHFRIGSGFGPGKKRLIHAVEGVSFKVDAGKTLCLVGESGCGKTTIGRCILRIIEPSGGRVFFEDTEVTALPKKAVREMRRDMQIIFQDPYGSLPPRMRLLSILEEPLKVHGLGTPSSRRERVEAIIERVGLRHEYISRFPHEFSGGQRQRIAIARALMLNPKLIVADEPVSALDVSIQAQIINLMVGLQQELNLSYLFITHDLRVVKYLATRVAVMYLGRIVEVADREDIFTDPLHPYTKALVGAIPRIRTRADREQVCLTGEVPNPMSPPQGCSFHPRCDYRLPICERIQPELVDRGDGHSLACHLGRNQ